jgi:hypothetical protein
MESSKCTITGFDLIDLDEAVTGHAYVTFHCKNRIAVLCSASLIFESLLTDLL